MNEYTPPLDDMQFVLTHLAGLEAVSHLPGCEDASPDLVAAILEEAGKFAQGVLSPLNRVGDREGARWEEGEVITATGWKKAYAQFCEGGWPALACHPDFGGQGLPKLVSCAVMEMWKSANMAFSLCSMLTSGAIEAVMLRGTDAQKALYLPKMVSGEWTGTMNLTEPNAGSDLAAVRARAIPTPEGQYRVFGQKIFITYGEHDLTENIIHLVLARLPDAPEGVKGISLFVVPKYLVHPDGGLGARNDVRCVSIEHKLGIHASPTCVLSFGDGEGAIGELIGEPNRGLEYMFIMMNEARFAVGMEGLGLSERALQQAIDYARDRIQGTRAGVRGGGKVPIIEHPDIMRMLMLMKSKTESMRALAYTVAAAFDKAHAHPDEAIRAQEQAFVDLMIPVIKGWCTENAVEIASLGVQVHGGMGFIEETGAAQHLRDARITPIYEGTTAIQANDLVGRKIARESGQTVLALMAQMRETAQSLQDSDGPELRAIGMRLAQGVEALGTAVAFIVETYPKSIADVLAGAVPFLHLLGTVAGGWQMGYAAQVAQTRRQSHPEEAAFCTAKIATARFYADHVLVQAPSLALTVTEGAASVLACERTALAAS
jgi:3-(methylthio)propanoyl-CoA dehydrogenase